MQTFGHHREASAMGDVDLLTSAYNWTSMEVQADKDYEMITTILTLFDGLCFKKSIKHIISALI